MIKCPVCGVDDSLDNFSLYADAWVVYESNGGAHKAVGASVFDYCEVKHVGDLGHEDLFTSRDIVNLISDNIEPTTVVDLW